jgi:hypothetical protein
MFQWFWRLLFESNPAEFRSAYALAESVERLRAATKRSAFSALSETAAVAPPFFYIILPSTGTISSATILMILMRGLIAGPAVSL